MRTTTTGQLRLVLYRLTFEIRSSVASLGGRGERRTAQGDTLQGGDTQRKIIFVGKFTKNSGETRSDR